jgi:hypothetical protein
VFAPSGTFTSSRTVGETVRSLLGEGAVTVSFLSFPPCGSADGDGMAAPRPLDDKRRLGRTFPCLPLPWIPKSYAFAASHGFPFALPPDESYF